MGFKLKNSKAPTEALGAWTPTAATNAELAQFPQAHTLWRSTSGPWGQGCKAVSLGRGLAQTWGQPWRGDQAAWPACGQALLGCVSPEC